jgi:hypothetical protein
MFWWKKKKQLPTDNDHCGTTGTSPVGSEDNFDAGKTLEPLTVASVMDRFLVQNPTPTPYSVHALVKAGANELLTSEEVLEVCAKIRQHGYQYPLNPTLMAELDELDLLPFLRWQALANVPIAAYQNENSIRQLIDDFRLRKRYR